MPVQNSAFKQLDPERIVLNVQRPQANAQQLAPEQTIGTNASKLSSDISMPSTVNPAAENQLLQPHVQKLGDETLWQNQQLAAIGQTSAQQTKVMPVIAIMLTGVKPETTSDEIAAQKKMNHWRLFSNYCPQPKKLRRSLGLSRWLYWPKRH